MPIKLVSVEQKWNSTYIQVKGVQVKHGAGICICGGWNQISKTVPCSGNTGNKPIATDFQGTIILEVDTFHTVCKCLAGLCVTVQWPALRYLRLMTAKFTRSHADTAEGTIIGVTHFIYSLTPTFILSSSASPCPHIFPSLGHSASLSLYPTPAPALRQPTNGPPHWGRRGHSNLWAGRKEEMFNGLFTFYLLREPCYMLMDSAAVAWPPSASTPLPTQSIRAVPPATISAKQVLLAGIFFL